MQVKGAALTEVIKPGVFRYTAAIGESALQVGIIPTATSRRVAVLRINGLDAPAGKPVAARLDGEQDGASFTIEVVSPDRSVKQFYQLKVTKT
jgi:hypothetical protein